jgi:hypothetical protein
LARTGRPRASKDYAEGVGDRICELLSEGVSLNKACAQLGMHEATVRKWAVFDENGFGTKYARARMIAYHKMADELSELAHNPGKTEIRTYGGKRARTLESRVVREATERSKHIVDTHKWIVSRLLPKIYGPKVGIDPETDSSDVNVLGGLPPDPPADA